jgi:hypothetical protein
MNKVNLNFEGNAIKSIIVDFIFTFLPLIVIILIRFFTLKYENIFLRSDFSFISMILFGQTIIKLFAGISENENKKQTIKIVLDMSLIISFGLVPSIVILVLIEIGYNNKVLLISQFIWLIASVGVYLFFGTIGNILERNKLIKESDLISDENKK